MILAIGYFKIIRAIDMTANSNSNTDDLHTVI